MRGHRSRRIPLAAAATAVFVGCAGQPGGSASDGLRVATTVSPITSITANIACPDATVTGLVPEGTNSHTFEPPPSAARALAEADAVFVNGLKLEDPTRELAEKHRKPDSSIVSLGDETLTPDQYIFDFSFPKEGGKPNPHLWTDPPLAKRYAEIVRDTLVNKDPGNASAYRSRFDRYAAKLGELDTALREATATLPREKRKLLTYHDAYAYFAKDYDWTVIGAIQVSSFEEPTPKEVAGLIKQIRDEKVPAIFGSEVFPSPVLEQIGKESGARYVDELRDDDLPGKPGDPNHSYLGLMKFDYVTMVRALGGDPSAIERLDTADVVKDCATYPQ